MTNENEPSDRSKLSSSGLRPAAKRAEKTRHSEGERVGDRYRLGKQLGEGGMGEVWLAHNETLDIDVAIKVIRTGDENREEYTDRLLKEARAAARLGHAAIVRVNDFGKTDAGEPFIVMELLHGEDLADSLAKRGRLSAVKAVRTLLPIAHALTTAHAQGIVHRDIKPENIFLARSEGGQLQPKVVDFGVAKLEITHSIRPADTGAMLGSPLYMSPEQARGDDVDHRADIWSLAVVLYETLTGRPPFEGKNYNSVLYSIVANPIVPITELGAGDAELWAILERALQKDPDRRWYSMRDFGEALASWLRDRNVTEDICGASLQACWFQWNQTTTEDSLTTNPPDGISSESEQFPVPDIPPPPLLPSRAREITVRTQRPTRPRTTAWAIGAIAVLAGLLTLVWAMRPAPAPVTKEAQPTAERPPSVRILSDEEVANDPSVAGPIDEDTAPPSNEPALAASALPVADEAAPVPVPHRRSKAPTAPPTPAATAPPPSAGKSRRSPAHQIVTKDPYE